MSQNTSERIRVGIAGLGRSGWNIHAMALEPLGDLYQVVAALDAREERRAEAAERFGCKTYEKFEDLVADPDVDLLVVATPNHVHADHSIAALKAGKDVVCEKPMATSVADANRMVEVAEQTGKVLAPFQNRRYDPVFVKLREIIDSGVLGRIVQIRLAAHGFARRWDWQTLQKFGGGTLNNTGPHFLDQALQFFTDVEPDVFCHLDRALTLGDADDHDVVILSAPNHPLVQMEITAACAYPQSMWLVMGTRGTLQGTFSSLQWKWTDFSQLPERQVETEPTPGRSYNSEKIEFQEDSWQMPEDKNGISWTHQEFYRDLFKTIREGKPLFITPDSVRKQIEVLHKCHEMCPLPADQS